MAERMETRTLRQICLSFENEVCDILKAFADCRDAAGFRRSVELWLEKVYANAVRNRCIEHE